MDFSNLFKTSKTVESTIRDKKEQIFLLFEQKIKEFELRLKNEKSRASALKDEAKQILDSGDKEGARIILFKKKLVDENIKRLNETFFKLEEQKYKFQNIEINSQDLNNFEKNYYTIIRKYDEEVRKEISINDYEKEIDMEISNILNSNKFNGNYNENEMRNKIIQLEQRIISLEKKVNQLENKNNNGNYQNNIHRNNSKDNGNYNNNNNINNYEDNNVENELNEFLAI